MPARGTAALPHQQLPQRVKANATETRQQNAGSFKTSQPIEQQMHMAGTMQLL